MEEEVKHPLYGVLQIPHVVSILEHLLDGVSSLLDVMMPYDEVGIVMWPYY
jgi:hypothetical protein